MVNTVQREKDNERPNYKTRKNKTCDLQVAQKKTGLIVKSRWCLCRFNQLFPVSLTSAMIIPGLGWPLNYHREENHFKTATAMMTYSIS